MTVLSDLVKLPDPPQNMDEWFRQEIILAQSAEDRDYVGRVNNFVDQSASWVTTQTMRRAQGMAVDPFQIKIPQRRAVTAGETLGSLILTPLPADPNLHMPVLPPPPVPAPVTPGSGPFGPSGGAPAPGGTDTNSLALDNNKMLKAICARMSITLPL